MFSPSIWMMAWGQDLHVESVLQIGALGSSEQQADAVGRAYPFECSSVMTMNGANWRRFISPDKNRKHFTWRPETTQCHRLFFHSGLEQLSDQVKFSLNSIVFYRSAHLNKQKPTVAGTSCALGPLTQEMLERFRPPNSWLRRCYCGFNEE